MFFPIEPGILVCVLQTGIFATNGVESPFQIIDPEMKGQERETILQGCYSRPYLGPFLLSLWQQKSALVQVRR